MAMEASGGAHFLGRVLGAAGFTIPLMSREYGHLYMKATRFCRDTGLARLQQMSGDFHVRSDSPSMIAAIPFPTPMQRETKA